MVVKNEFVAIHHILVLVSSFRPRSLLILWLICTGTHIAIRVGASISSSASPTGT